MADPQGSARPRVALVSVRFTMFDAQMDPGFPDRMRSHLARSADILRSRFDVIDCPLIENAPGAKAVAKQLADTAAEVVVFAPAMAAPPSLADAALAGIDAPVIIWNAPSISRLPSTMVQAEATEHTTTVGAVMYANVRIRRGLPTLVVTAAHDDATAVDHVLRTVHAAAVARRVRGTTLLRIGDPITGYLDVEASPRDLAQLGIRASVVERSTWEAAVTGVSDADAAACLTEIERLGWVGEAGPAAMISARVAVALDRLFDATGAAAGTVNCHGPWFRDSPAVGVTACLGVACQALQGRSLSCTGDLATSVALLIARRLSDRALYCECYAPDIEANLVLVAAGGEGDPVWAGERVHVEPNHHYPGRNGPGTAVSFALESGPATLLSASPTAGGWVLAWATGEIVEARYPALGGPNGMFRFDSGPVGEALSRWIASGATHHAALARGRLDVELPVLTETLGIAGVRC
jgi:L-arabinose isomerase